MKRIYTQVIQTTLTLAMFLLVGNVATAQCDIPPPDGALWGTQFDGGLDGWEALDGNFEPRTDMNGDPIGWTWEADGNLSRGSFATDQAIPSPSVCNGAMVFDSDFFDSGGNSALGSGLCPSNEAGQFCDGILMSPSIDLSESGATDFVLQFASQHRHFTSEYYVLVSVDDGQTWIDTVTVFPDGFIEAVTNGGHLYTEEVRLPLCGLSAEKSVRLAFWYRGSYYYWGVDDVWLLEATEPDLRVNDNWFATSVTYGTPAVHAMELAFLADIENRSPIGTTGATLTVEILNDAGNTEYSQELAYEAIGGCGLDENKVFPDMYLPQANVGDVKTIRYTISSNDGDGAPLNDTREAQFRYTENEWIKVIPESQSGVGLSDNRFGAETVFQSFGSGFYVEEDGYALDAVTFGIETDGPNGDPLTSGIVEVTIYEWIDLNNDGEVNGDPANEKIKKGSVTVLTDVIGPGLVYENRREIVVNPVDEDGEDIILDGGSQYLAICHFNPFNGSNYYNIVYSQSEVNRDFFDGPMEFAYGLLDTPDNNISARIGTVGAVDGVTHEDRDLTRNFIPVFWGTSLVNISQKPINTGAEDINENIGINIYPNPTTEKVFADVALENTSDKVTLEVMDMTGKIVLTQTWNNIQRATLDLDVSALTDGTYIMNVRTAEGINTQKFTVHQAK